MRAQALVKVIAAVLAPLISAETRSVESAPRVTTLERALVDRLLPAITLVLLGSEAARTRARTVPPAVVAGAAALLLGNIVKRAVRRERPRSRPAAGTRRYSFPSTHAAVAIAVALTGTASAPPWLTVTAHAAVVCAALGRIRDGRHYPSDVLAGAMLGAVAGAVARGFASPRDA